MNLLPSSWAVYNAAGPGQPLSEHDRAAILALPAHEIDLIVSLTCRICPDVVTVAQHIAALNPKLRSVSVILSIMVTGGALSYHGRSLPYR